MIFLGGAPETLLVANIQVYRAVSHRAGVDLAVWSEVVAIRDRADHVCSVPPPPSYRQDYTNHRVKTKLWQTLIHTDIVMNGGHPSTHCYTFGAVTRICFARSGNWSMSDTFPPEDERVISPLSEAGML